MLKIVTKYIFVFFSLFSTHINCLLDEPETISGSEANQIVTPRVLAKIHSCGLLVYRYDPNDSNPDPLYRSLSIETSNTFFLMATLFIKFEAFNLYERYKAKDIYRCADDLDLVSCDVIASQWLTDLNAGGFVGSLICEDVMKRSIYDSLKF
ncbi:hypothetical protein [Leptospira licerasiae]|uniref:hypothetical protein n=1 Tax=Leptospira licerasiae TaxID=447106 RepID=UPI001082DDDD|nr:hypothetical protein [Leptospira licerasiae]TGM88997.1 hypothetical protein EHR05_12410 [Leptospira licerasiae]